ncbi:hypothetical protein BaRGS_00016677 [Batillaria attramentaria]|uniref:3-hydroxyacyl-CoA dehydrogenase n=1 Tax=Batillaria attramentaria TaxID=370345 RepID=A0ABD0KXY3_9CAEN
MADNTQKVAIIGSGNIGRSWALLFSSAGFRVCLYDNNPAQLSNVIDHLKGQLDALVTKGLSRGDLSAEQQLQNVTLSNDLATCVKDAVFVMECVSEILDVKLAVFKLADDNLSDGAIMASSTSSMLPSVLSVDLNHRDHFLVAHPTNPPFFARAVELVPAPWTSADVMKRSRDLMVRLGQAPIVMKKEIPGFVLNRMQFAIFSESWRLVRDGIVDVDGLNKAVWSGLGARYAFLGPFEVGHLNATGIEGYLKTYGPMMYRLQSSMGETGPIGGQLAQDIQDALVVHTPLNALNERRRWREMRMAALAKLKQDMDRLDEQEAKEGKVDLLPSDH